MVCQAEDAAPRPFLPIVAAVVGVFGSLPFFQALELPDNIITVLVMQRWTVSHYLKIPSLQEWQSFANIKLMKLISSTWFQIDRENLDDTIWRSVFHVF